MIQDIIKFLGSLIPIILEEPGFEKNQKIPQFLTKLLKIL